MSTEGELPPENILAYLVPTKDIPQITATLVRNREDFRCEYAGEEVYKVYALSGAVIASANAEITEYLARQEKIQNKLREEAAQVTDLIIHMEIGKELPDPYYLSDLIWGTPPYFAMDLDKYLKAHESGYGSPRVHSIWTTHSRSYVKDILDQLRSNDTTRRFTECTINRARQALYAVPIISEVNPEWLSRFKTFTHFNGSTITILTLSGAILRKSHRQLGIDQPVDWDEYADGLQESLVPQAMEYLKAAYAR